MVLKTFQLKVEVIFNKWFFLICAQHSYKLINLHNQQFLHVGFAGFIGKVHKICALSQSGQANFAVNALGKIFGSNKNGLSGYAINGYFNTGKIAIWPCIKHVVCRVGE